MHQFELSNNRIKLQSKQSSSYKNDFMIMRRFQKDIHLNAPVWIEQYRIKLQSNHCSSSYKNNFMVMRRFQKEIYFKRFWIEQQPNQVFLNAG